MTVVISTDSMELILVNYCNFSIQRCLGVQLKFAGAGPASLATVCSSAV